MPARHFSFTACAAVVIVGCLSAGVGAAVDRHVGEPWSSSVLSTTTNAFAVTGNLRPDGTFFTAEASGAKYNYFDGVGNATLPVNSTVYSTITTNRTVNEELYGSGSLGTDYMDYVGGGAWVTTQISPTTYRNIATTNSGAEMIAVKADGSGVEQLFNTGVVGAPWGTSPISSTDYLAVATDPLLRYDFFAAKPDGGADHVFYGGGQWNTAPIAPTVGIGYVSLAASSTNSYSFFGAKETGGVDHIYYGGSQWNVTSNVTTDLHSALGTDFQGALAFFGATPVPEPTSLAALAIAALLAGRRRRR